MVSTSGPVPSETVENPSTGPTVTHRPDGRVVPVR